MSTADELAFSRGECTDLRTCCCMTALVLHAAVRQHLCYMLLYDSAGVTCCCTTALVLHAAVRQHLCYMLLYDSAGVTCCCTTALVLHAAV